MVLFDNLPKFPPSLPDDELRLLAALPDLPTMAQVTEDERSPAMRLRHRGLIKTETDECGMFAGKTPASGLRPAAP